MSCHRHRKVDPWKTKRSARRMRRRRRASWARNDRAKARAMYLRVMNVWWRRNPDEHAMRIANNVMAAWRNPFGNGSKPKRESERMKAALREVWRQTAPWRMRDPRCGLCGGPFPRTPCWKPCEENPF